MRGSNLVSRLQIKAQVEMHTGSFGFPSLKTQYSEHVLSHELGIMMHQRHVQITIY